MARTPSHFNSAPNASSPSGSGPSVAIIGRISVGNGSVPADFRRPSPAPLATGCCSYIKPRPLGRRVVVVSLYAIRPVSLRLLCRAEPSRAVQLWMAFAAEAGVDRGGAQPAHGAVQVAAGATGHVLPGVLRIEQPSGGAGEDN